MIFDYPIITIYRNGNINKQIEVTLRPDMSLVNLINDAMELFKYPTTVRCKLFDQAGYELTDDDVDFLDSEAPLFLSKGEKFKRNSCLALYEQLGPLGEGGFGAVFLYLHKFTKQQVAIKFVELSVKNSSPEAINRVFNEMAHLREMKHPSVVQLIDAFPHQDQYCFVMEYWSGGELGQYLKEQGRLQEDQVYTITSQMVDGMRNCHTSKIIHRDLKPENILFGNMGRTRIKIVDFGVAGLSQIGAKGEKSTAGSILYMAPEILSGLSTGATPAIDIWSMGCIIYLMLTGKLPFLGNDKPEVKENIIKCTYKKLSKFKYVSPPWNKLVCGMLRKPARKRWKMLKIIDHITHYRMHPDGHCDPPSDYSDDEEKEEIKTARPPRHGRRGTAPVTFKMPDPRGSALSGVDSDQEQPNYMKPLRNRTPEARKSQATRLNEAKQRRHSIMLAGAQQLGRIRRTSTLH